MTLRDVGAWFGETWASVADGLHIATTEAFWDWPLWLSIPVGIAVPWFLIWLMANHVQEMAGTRASFWGTVGFGVGATLCAYVTYDVWFQMGIFEEGSRALPYMRFGYPIMTTIFGFACLQGIVSRMKHRADDTTPKDHGV